MMRSRSRNKSKKAQVQSQIFIYVIAIVVVGMILIFGYNAVKDFGKRAEEVALIQFEKDMTSTFRTMSASYGKVEIKRIEVPGGFDTVCFADNSAALNSLTTNPILYFNDTEYPIVTESIESLTEKNLFLIGGLDIESFFVGDIRVTDEFSKIYDASRGFLCFKEKQGRVEFKLAGKGDHVEVNAVKK